MPNPIRFATFNASLNRNEEGQLITDLSTEQNEQGKTVAEIIQRVNPDVLLVNEFDFDSDGTAAQLFRDNYLEVSQNGVNPVEYPFVYFAPSNTGIYSGFDLDNNEEIVTTPGEFGYGNDAFGFGNFPGQFGMVLYSKYPIVEEEVRTFQNFLWKDMPGALLPDNLDTPEPNDWYSEEELEVFRLSSKSHWDVPINVNGEIVHVLVSHPTPPVFDGEEDRNGRRNHDEIRFWADYVTPGEGDYIYDDAGNFGGLAAGNSFVIMGDQNADPVDGDSFNNTINQLLENPLVNTSVIPGSNGGIDATNRQGGESANHGGNPAFDTADFNDAPGTSGNLRVDYVLPSIDQEIVDAAVFWPEENDSLFDLVGDFPFPSSDHRLVWADVTNENRKTVTNIEFIGGVEFETGLEFQGTEVGGISGISYDRGEGIYYAISDDRSQNNDARFYTVDIDWSDGTLDDGDVEFTDFTTLLNNDGVPFPENGVDPEGIAFNGENLFISSEGNVNEGIDPFVNEFSLTGEQLNELTIPDKFLPNNDGTQGIRNNQAFESLTITPDKRFLYTATESALVQDGERPTLENESASRIIKYDLETGEAIKEFLYFVDPIPVAPDPEDGFADNGLVELLALDNSDTLLALERSFAVGVGNNIRLYEVQLQNTTNIQDFDGLINPDDPDGELFDVDAVAEKRLLLDFAELGITLDNDEGMAFGPVLPDGSQSLVVVSDNNFNNVTPQVTQFLGFSLDIDSIPAVNPTVETPDTNRIETGVDSDDPAIYVHPNNPNQSLVISTLKDAGLAVYDLKGEVLQEISPETPGDVRYNNVDIVYNFQIGDETVDLAVATDRANDTLAIWSIDPQTRQLTNITAGNLSNPTASIFGIDDGEQTAYGLATYTNPNTGETYAFVSQRDGNQIAQLELISNEDGTVSATEVRRLDVPIPEGGELDDAQVEGMVVDQELGFLYAGQENFGIWKFDAEVDGSNDRILVDEIGENIQADVEGLTIYYGDNGNGYLLASSQGNNTFAVYEREGDNEYIGNFFVGDFANIDGAEESDGADVINVPLGNNFPNGLLVIQDGANEPEAVLQDPEDGEIQNFNTNFKFIPWENVANAFEEPLEIDSFSYNPRQINVNIPTVSINVEPETVSENAGQYTLTFNLSEAAPAGGLQVIWSETDADDAFGDIEFPPELTNASNLEQLQAAGDELARSAITIEEGATTATVTWTTIPDEESEGEETTTIELIETEDYVVDPENQVAQVTIVDAVAEEIIGTPEDEPLNGNFGDDTITGLAGDDTLVGGGGDDSIIGSRGNDSLYGQDGDDVLEGRLGFDHLFGGDGDDEMNGGQGRDRLNGGSGNDTLSGGASIDRFIFATNQEFDADDIGVDEITDFVVGQDKILLDRTTFTAINSIATEFATVTSNNAAATSEAVIVYNSNNGGLFYNPNVSAGGFGDGGQFATLSNGALLEVDDFIIRG
ncbi:MAG: phytase [Okeania sp. SIO2G4]|uniref:phytase n=1 Tax=unclassified Okeania TaxID=2634635 RepID=UPI0013BD4825|nr:MULTISPECIES: phytase [unclassified Okeania]NEP75234.1 phytase [Okeania sp. SIO2G5]NEP96315.1 phytase [Okeania sp. SIO2F5]NEQ94029.1 phytase [Okeania sp. SIO2G4]